MINFAFRRAMLFACLAPLTGQAVGADTLPFMNVDSCTLKQLGFVPEPAGALIAITPPVIEHLEELAKAWLIIHGPITIRSSTNSREAQTDPALGEARAQQIREILLAKGVPAEYIWTRVEEPHPYPAKLPTGGIDTESGVFVSAIQLSLKCRDEEDQLLIDWLRIHCIENRQALPGICEKVLQFLHGSASHALD